VGRDAGVFKDRDGRWEGMLAFLKIIERRRERDAGV
jgi:hypothetical protein